MGKKKKLYHLHSKIGTDIEQVNLLLDFIASDKVDTLIEASILADIALNKTKNIDKNNEKIGKIFDL